MFAKSIALLHLFGTLALAQQVCHFDYCCDGFIVGNCNGQDPSNFICCEGDSNVGLDSCVNNNGDGQPTCTAGQATPLTAAGGGATSIIGISQNFGSSTTSAAVMPSSSSQPSFSDSSVMVFTSDVTGVQGTTILVSGGVTVSNGVTLGSGTARTPATGAGGSASASPSSSDNAAAALKGANGLPLGAVPLAWLLGGF